MQSATRTVRLAPSARDGRRWLRAPQIALQRRYSDWQAVVVQPGGDGTPGIPLFPECVELGGKNADRASFADLSGLMRGGLIQKLFDRCQLGEGDLSIGLFD